VQACIFREQHNGGWLAAVEKCQSDESQIDAAKHPSVNPEYSTDVIKDVLKHGTNDENTPVLSVARDLFNQDAKEAPEGNSKVDELAAAWADWFGDYELIFVTKTKTGGNEPLKHARDVVEKRIPPNKKISELADGIAVQRFNDARALLYEMCMKAGDKYNDLNHVGPIGTNGGKWFWSKENLEEDDVKELIWRLSTPEKPLQAVVMNALMSNFDYLMGQRTHYNRTHPTWKCEDLMADYDSPEWDGESDPPPQEMDTVSEEHPVYETFVMLNDYAKFVAVSQVLHTFEEALNYVAQRSAGPGSVSASVADYARQLIYDVAQTPDVYAAIQYNLQEWDRFIADKIFARRKLDSGRKGNKVLADKQGRGRQD